MKCTALVWVPRPVLQATQVERKVGEKVPVASAVPGARGITLGKDRDAGNYRNYAKMETSKLDLFIKDRVPEVLRLHNVFYGRVSEFVAALMEMRSRFENQGARNDLHELKVRGWHDYLKKIGVNPSTFRTWKHRTETKQLADIVDPPSAAINRKGSAGTSRKPGPNQAQISAAQAAVENLADAERQLGAAAAGGKVEAAAIIAEYEQAVTAADSCVLTNENKRTADSSVAIDPTESESAGVRPAEESLLFAALPVAGSKVESALDKLDPSVSEFNAEPDWKQVLVELIALLEQSGDRLPLVVLKEKRKIESLLAGKRPVWPEGSTMTKLQRATHEEGLLFEATPKLPIVEREIVPDQARDAMAIVRNVLSRVADTAVIESAMQSALEEVVRPMLDEHPYMEVDRPFLPELQISVTFYRAGRARISADDWVEYRGGDDRLTKQIGAEVALGRVVDAGLFSRPRVTWFNGTKWLKPYTLFDQEAVHVLFADQAVSAHPEAFNAYSEPAPPRSPAATGIDCAEDPGDCNQA